MSRRAKADSPRSPVTAWLVLLAVVIVAGARVVAPSGDGLGRELEAFFGASAQVLATLLVALALFQGATVLAGRHARKFLSLAVFPLIGLGLAASLAGLLDGLSADAYRWLFAITVGTGGAALVSVLMVGGANIRGQNLDEVQETMEAIRAHAKALDPRPPNR